MVLEVEQPMDCPLRFDEHCTIYYEENDGAIQYGAIQYCSVDFVFPDGCPLRKAPITLKKAE